MKRFWFDHCTDPQQKKEFKERLGYSQDIFNILKVKMEKELKVVQTSRHSLKSYLTMNYTAFQADRNATERTLLEIIDLLPLMENNDE